MPDAATQPVVAPPSNGDGIGGAVAIITGGHGSIGQATARAFAREGARVYCFDLPPDDPAKSEGRVGSSVAVDVTDEAAVEHAVASVLQDAGRIDIAVAAAGIAAGTDLADITPGELHRVLDVNLGGVINLLRAVVPAMTEQRYGKFVALGSVAARVGGVKAGPHYVAAKSGVHGLVKWAAKRYGPAGIFVNAIAPGPVLTPMWAGLNAGEAVEQAPGYPLGRLGLPEDVAETALFLASPASNWITGATVDINGGLYMS
jgi:3-oxoacyl-[acyl-carrier protein] reductase